MLLSILLASLLGVLPLRTADEATNAFGDGEKLTFTVHYNWGVINADVAKAYTSCTIEKDLWGEDCYHTRIWGRSARFFDMFFKIREDFQSWFTVDGLRPSRFTRDTHEGSYECTNDFHYMWDIGVINATLYSSKKGHRQIEIPLEEGVYDVPSLLYACRNLDLDKVKEGDSVPVTFAIDDDVYTIKLKRLATEVVDVDDVGKVRAVKFSIGVVAGEMFESEDVPIYMWFSDDDNRIPVLFEAMVKIGAMTGHLSTYKGLRHPFDALVN